MLRRGTVSCLAVLHKRSQKSTFGGVLYHALAGPVLPSSRHDEDDRRREAASLPRTQVASFHTSGRNERAAAIVLGLATISAASFAGAQGIKAYNEWKASQPEVPAEEESQASDTKEEPSSQKKESSEGRRENIFAKWFNAGVGSKFYEGGFEEKMTRREAALILGVRESSTAKRIKEAHRKLLILNHPDTGGSTYLAGKLNEAKELLMKGKQA